MKLNRPLAAAVVSLVVCFSTLAQTMIFQGRVVDVIDGSTMVVETQTKTRFVVKCQGTKAPQQSEHYADESRQRLSNLVMTKVVSVEYAKRDEFGHLLGTVFLNEEDICLDQVSVGLAWFDPEAPNTLKTSRRELYASIEENARKGSSGVWTTSMSGLSNRVGDQATVDVSGYIRKDRTYVSPHKRTEPNPRFDDDWTTSSKTGKSWFARNWWIFPTVGALVGTGFVLRARARSTELGGLGILCNDGTVSQAQHRQGACSHHGGIR